MPTSTDVPTADRPWLAQYDAEVPQHIGYPTVRLDQLLRSAARRYPERPALVFADRSTSYLALDRAVDRMAGGLRGLGLADGDRVAVLLPNCPQLVAAMFAVWRAHGVVVPLSPRSTPAEFVRQVSDSGASIALIADQLAAGTGSTPMPPDLHAIVLVEVADGLALDEQIVSGVHATSPRSTGPHSRVIRLRDLLLAATADVGAAAGPSEPAVLLYTGGTTGLPKAAVLTHRNLVANACQLGAWSVGLDDGAEVMLSALPLAHGYALTACMNVSILRGWTQVLVPDPRDIDRLLAEIDRWAVTVLPGVPTLYAAISEHPDVRSGLRNVRSIEACISGAASLPSGVKAEFERLTGGRLVEGYGLTEASPATHCNPLGRGGRSGSIGLPLPDTECRLVDIETELEVVAPGAPGVLCIRGPQVMSGYWRRPVETDQALRDDAEGRTWLHTGDIAEMASDGFFRIVDRKKDVIVAAGGLKVYPNEVEDVLSTHPKVRQAAVIGVQVGVADQRAKAFLVLRDGMHAEPAEILAFLRERLAPYKVPKAIEFRPILPVAFTGKVLRRVLAEEQARADAEPAPHLEERRE